MQTMDYTSYSASLKTAGIEFQHLLLSTDAKISWWITEIVVHSCIVILSICHMNTFLRVPLPIASKSPSYSNTV